MKKNNFEDKCNEKDKYMEDNDDNNEEKEMEDNDDNKKEEEENFQICLRKFSDLSGKIFILFLTNIFNIGNTGTELREQGRGSPGELGQSFVSFLGKLPYIKCE